MMCLSNNCLFDKQQKITNGGWGMSNLEIRKKLLSNAIKNYQLADAIGINQSTLSVWLRTELNDERRDRVEKALDQLINNK